MFETILMLFIGLALSGVAAWFSVVGLIAIFSAAPLSIMIMGGTLEVAKLVCASWVYNNWHVAPRAIKGYLSAAVLMLMFITSMGIFGYLSKAHLEQRAATSDTSLQLERMEQEIAVKEKQLERLQGTEDRLNRAVDALIEKDRVSQALAQRQRMQRELRSVASEKKGLQADIDKLYEAKIPLDISNRQIEAEIGPLKYIAELIYGEQAKSHFDQAVRAVIIILIVVFDPLAVIMLISANFGMAEYRKRKLVPVVTEAVPTAEPIVEPIVETVIEPVAEKVPEIVVEQPIELAIVEQEPSPKLVDITEPEPSPPEEYKDKIAKIKWDPLNRTWIVPEKLTHDATRQLINSRYQKLNEDYVSIDGKTQSRDSLRWSAEMISLERVLTLMGQLTKGEITVEDLTWSECEAILKYLDNDKLIDLS
jgi:hypothetical protein